VPVSHYGLVESSHSILTHYLTDCAQDLQAGHLQFFDRTGGFVVDGGAISHYYGTSTSVTTIENLELGAISFDDDAGKVSWVNVPISSSVPAGTPEAYSATRRRPRSVTSRPDTTRSS